MNNHIDLKIILIEIQERLIIYTTTEHWPNTLTQQATKLPLSITEFTEPETTFSCHESRQCPLVAINMGI